MSDYKYKYEVHMHTSQSSRCGKTPGADYIAEFKRLGYTGMIVTDHFYHGNTAADRSLNWEGFVKEFCRGYEAAREEGEKQGFDVFFGWEENQHGDEFLVYGPGKEWLIKHPEILNADQQQYFDLIHEAGGVVVQAHPFRERDYLAQVNIHPYQCDAMEVCNFGNPVYQDAFAYNYAKKFNKVMTSGTDLHDVKNLAPSISGMCFEKPLTSAFDYADAIRSGKGFMPLIPEERKIMTADMKNLLPLYEFDEKNIPHATTLEKIFG